MKTTLTLSSALRITIGQFAARLPSHLSMGAGVEPDQAKPYFVELRITSGGFTRNRHRMRFDSEQDVQAALLDMEAELGLPPVPSSDLPERKGFSDLALELAALGTTASIASS